MSVSQGGCENVLRQALDYCTLRNVVLVASPHPLGHYETLKSFHRRRKIYNQNITSVSSSCKYNSANYVAPSAFPKDSVLDLLTTRNAYS